MKKGKYTHGSSGVSSFGKSTPIFGAAFCLYTLLTIATLLLSAIALTSE